MNFSMNSKKNHSLLNELADQNNLAIVLADEDSSVLGEANNNSMCRLLYNSAEFSSSCAEFCGKAFKWATETESEVEYQCYAGLNCMAVQTKNKRSVAIIGRVFLKSEDYRNATERAAEGDWQQFPAAEFFSNTLFGNSKEDLKKTAKNIAKIADSELLEIPVLKFAEQDSASETKAFEIEISAAEEAKLAKLKSSKIETQKNPKSQIRNLKLQEWRSLFGSFLKSEYEQACHLVADFLAQIYAVSDLAWLERGENHLEKFFAEGSLDNEDIKLNIAANDENLLEAVRTKTPLELRERKENRENGEADKAQTIWLFPFAVGGEAQSALIVGDELSPEKRRKINRFCQKVAPQLEIARLRGKLSKSNSIERAIEKFNESLKSINADDFWLQLVAASAELMRAERSSLLIFDEKDDNFTVKAATGIKADFIKSNGENLGERVSKNVLEIGKAVVVKDVKKIGLQSAPTNWQYKSGSFISYPIEIAGRKIGVLNLTDKADGKNFDAADLKLLDSVMPSLAVMIDRADLETQADEFKQLSVTDPLTGLLNRRYLEERLTEEIKRSNRHGFPMSFMMIDVDEFKSYNDNFGHTEGDKALQIVGACLKETLRGADVAARYGGEEFSILLPQTSSAEAAVIGERVRERVENEFFPHRKVTISVGIASCSLSLNSAQDVIAAADKALYEAKRKGRNYVQVYESLQNNFVAGKGKN